jgi:hypothetical protein
MRNTTAFKPEGKSSSLRRLGRKWENNIKIYLRDTGCVVSYKHGHEWGNLLSGRLTVTFRRSVSQGDGILFIYGFIYSRNCQT